MADEVLIYLLEHAAPADDTYSVHSIPGIVLANLVEYPRPGVTLSVDWAEFLGRSEQECITIIEGYYRREIKRLGASMREGSGTGQEMAPLLDECFASEFGEQEITRLATARWEDIQRGAAS